MLAFFGEAEEDSCRPWWAVLDGGDRRR